MFPAILDEPRLCFITDRRGATAVEFGLILAPFFFTLAGITESGLDFYIRNSLDNATQSVARQIMTGSVQGMKVNSVQINATQFRTNVVCPLLPAALSCSNVIVNIQTFAEGMSPSGFYNFVNSGQSGLVIPPLDNSKTSFCIGGSGVYVILQVLYPMPLLTAIFGGGSVTTYNGVKTRVLISTAAFKNEPFPATSYVAPTGC